MVSVKKIPQRSTQTRASSSLAHNPARISSRTGTDVESPLPSPPIATTQPIGATPTIYVPVSTDPTQSPLYMHNADHPGLQLISLCLDGSNYDDWNAAMRIALDAKNKIGFTDGSLTRPEISDPSFRLWSRCNSMVKSWILNSVSQQIYRSILRLNDAADIWKDLHGRFHMTNLPRTFNLTQEIQDLRQGSMSLSEYYTKLKTLWDNLESSDEPDLPCVCGNAVKIQLKAERAKIVKFLAGLNESYAIIRRQIIMKKALPSLVEVYNILDQDDSQRGFSSVVSPPAAFQVSENSSPLIDQSISYVQNGPNKGHPIYSFCKRVGHIAERCYKKHGFSPGFVSKFKPSEKGGTSTRVAAQVSLSNSPSLAAPDPTHTVENMIGSLSKDQIQQFIALFSSQLQAPSGSPQTDAVASTSGIFFSPLAYNFVGILKVSQHRLSSQKWVIDSGATHHVAHDKNIFVSLNSSLTSSVNLPTSSTIKVSGVGTIRLNDHILLHNVLFIPEFRLNLLSISSLTDYIGSSVTFDPSSCTIQDPTRELTIGQGKILGSLYVLDTQASPISVHAVVDIGIWHQRFGHPSYKKLDTISGALGTSRLKNKGKSFCHTCHLSKQKKLSDISHNNICKDNFELLHIDIWGPFSVETIEGFRYFLTIVDDHSRATWVYLLRTKDEVIQVFPDFVKQVETKYVIKLRSVRSDNAQELLFAKFYKDQGIIAYHSCPETPEQNSVVERKHQHILNVARALMFQSHVPLHFWGDCVLTAVFLINRTPAKLLQHKTPFEILTGTSSDYSQLKTFGCLCYGSTSPKLCHKFLPRSKACIFLGYPSGYKGYKLMDLESNRVFISRNVLFHEDLFPMKKNSPLHVPEWVTPHSEPSVRNTTPSSHTPHSTSHLPSEISKSRVKKVHVHLQDYHCYALASDTIHPTSNSLLLKNLSSHFAYINSITKILILTSYALMER